MTDRKWRIIQSHRREDFYDKIAKYESEGYKLIPESFNGDNPYCVLMLNSNL